jgi:hypothetical protein
MERGTPAWKSCRCRRLHVAAVLISTIPRKVEGESYAVMWKPDDGEEKMEKDRNLNFYSSTDEAVGVIPLPPWR